MKVYAIVGTIDYQGSSEPENIYFTEARADAICAELNAHSKYTTFYEVFEYEVQE